MGNIGYIFGYVLFFTFAIGCLIGYTVGVINGRKQK